MRKDHLTPLAPELAPAPPRETPYQAFLVLCEVTGRSPDDAPESFKQQQLGIARRILRAGYDLDDIRGCLQYLIRRVRSATVDLRLVYREIGAWVFSGRPGVAPASRSNLSATDILGLAGQLRGTGQ